jgi:hypothetical protein
MSNRTEALLPIVLDKAQRVPLKRQLYLAMRDMIVGGRCLRVHAYRRRARSRKHMGSRARRWSKFSNNCWRMI